MNLFENKTLRDLTLADLKQRLQDGQVQEGFFVEYKSEIKDDKLWKTVASFANTYGGFVFIGIGEDKVTKLPVSFNGVSYDGNSLERVRSIVEGNVHPFPSLEIVPVQCGEKGNAIIIVRVFESFSTPHICGNGVIYQRNGDASSPVKDRYLLDRLYEKTVIRREDHRKRMGNTITRRLIYGSYDWDRQKSPDRLAVCVLVMPELIDSQTIIADEVEQERLLREVGVHQDETRRLRDGTAAIFSNRTTIKRRRNWDWWKSEMLAIVYQDGLFEFCRQVQDIDSIGSSYFADVIEGYCCKIGQLLKDRLRPKIQTNLEIHILGAWGRDFFDEKVRERSCQCDHGIICLEYAVDLTDGNALSVLGRRAVKDMMFECGGAYKEA